MGSLDVGIAQHLEAKGFGDFASNPEDVVGESAIVVGEMMEDPDDMIAVLPVPGSRPDRILGKWPQYQIVNRAKSYAAARDQAELIFIALDQHQGALDGEPVGRIQPEFTPIYLTRDGSGIEGGRAEFTFTVTVYTR